ncbi:aldehyde dehydrogenase family protein [Rhodovulum sp. DZ06]|uniref:aldehyde dehydrogenase family protein n=1 Tax=Rhodovulum sp. DZ06 TaxID=3425126 RepID=UPI003D33C7AF
MLDQAAPLQAKMLTHGALTDGSARMEVLNPATAAVIGDAPRCSKEELDAVMDAARAAYPAWRDAPEAVRREAVSGLAPRIEAHLGEIAAILTAEQGKPLAMAKGEILSLLNFLKAQAKIELPVVVNEDHDKRVSKTWRVPLGVVAAISPWNFPVMLAWWKIAPALLAGNVVVLKPAPQTPLAALKVAELVADLFPAGVLQVISGGDELGPWVTAHPQVDKISFTGSTATGRRVMDSAAPSLKRLTLELGGNDPAIVFDDVNVKKTAAKLFWAAFSNSGQICIAAKRVYVQRGIYDAFRDALAEVAAQVKVGDGAEEGTLVGPIQNRTQFDRVNELLADSRAAGHQFAFEGEAPQGPGYFIPVTILDNPPEDSRIVREEQFGPVLPLLVFDDEDEVIARANDTEYGLGATIWTDDLDKAERVSRRIEAGTVWINEAIYLSPDAAFGGRKQSGLGAEHGEDAIMAVTEPQTVVMRRG